MRRFVLNRHEDISGVSGTGIVCHGVQFDDGIVVTHWLGTHVQTGVWVCIEDLEEIHGHQGATEIEWIDGPTESPATGQQDKAVVYGGSRSN